MPFAMFCAASEKSGLILLEAVSSICRLIYFSRNVHMTKYSAKGWHTGNSYDAPQTAECSKKKRRKWSKAYIYPTLYGHGKRSLLWSLSPEATNNKTQRKPIFHCEIKIYMTGLEQFFRCHERDKYVGVKLSVYQKLVKQLRFEGKLRWRCCHTWILIFCHTNNYIFTSQ